MDKELIKTMSVPSQLHQKIKLYISNPNQPPRATDIPQQPAVQGTVKSDPVTNAALAMATVSSGAPHANTIGDAAALAPGAGAIPSAAPAAAGVKGSATADATASTAARQKLQRAGVAQPGRPIHAADPGSPTDNASLRCTDPRLAGATATTARPEASVATVKQTATGSATAKSHSPAAAATAAKPSTTAAATVRLEPAVVAATNAIPHARSEATPSASTVTDPSTDLFDDEDFSRDTHSVESDRRHVEELFMEFQSKFKEHMPAEGETTPPIKQATGTNVPSEQPVHADLSLMHMQGRVDDFYREQETKYGRSRRDLCDIADRLGISSVFALQHVLDTTNPEDLLAMDSDEEALFAADRAIERASDADNFRALQRAEKQRIQIEERMRRKAKAASRGSNVTTSKADPSPTEAPDQVSIRLLPTDAAALRDTSPPLHAQSDVQADNCRDFATSGPDTEGVDAKQLPTVNQRTTAAATVTCLPSQVEGGAITKYAAKAADTSQPDRTAGGEGVINKDQNTVAATSFAGTAAARAQEAAAQSMHTDAPSSSQRRKFDVMNADQEKESDGSRSVKQCLAAPRQAGAVRSTHQPEQIAITTQTQHGSDLGPPTQAAPGLAIPQAPPGRITDAAYAAKLATSTAHAPMDLDFGELEQLKRGPRMKFQPTVRAKDQQSRQSSRALKGNIEAPPLAGTRAMVAGQALASTAVQPCATAAVQLDAECAVPLHTTTAAQPQTVQPPAGNAAQTCAVDEAQSPALIAVQSTAAQLTAAQPSATAQADAGRATSATAQRNPPPSTHPAHASQGVPQQLAQIPTSAALVAQGAGRTGLTTAQAAGSTGPTPDGLHRSAHIEMQPKKHKNENPGHKTSPQLHVPVPKGPVSDHENAGLLHLQTDATAQPPEAASAPGTAAATAKPHAAAATASPSHRAAAEPSPSASTVTESSTDLFDEAISSDPYTTADDKEFTASLLKEFEKDHRRHLREESRQTGIPFCKLVNMHAGLMEVQGRINAFYRDQETKFGRTRKDICEVSDRLGISNIFALQHILDTPNLDDVLALDSDEEAMIAANRAIDDAVDSRDYVAVERALRRRDKLAKEIDRKAEKRGRCTDSAASSSGTDDTDESQSRSVRQHTTGNEAAQQPAAVHSLQAKLAQKPTVEPGVNAAAAPPAAEARLTPSVPPQPPAKYAATRTAGPAGGVGAAPPSTVPLDDFAFLGGLKPKPRAFKPTVRAVQPHTGATQKSCAAAAVPQHAGAAVPATESGSLPADTRPAAVQSKAATAAQPLAGTAPQADDLAAGQVQVPPQLQAHPVQATHGSTQQHAPPIRTTQALAGTTGSTHQTRCGSAVAEVQPKQQDDQRPGSKGDAQLHARAPEGPSPDRPYGPEESLAGSVSAEEVQNLDHLTSELKQPQPPDVAAPMHVPEGEPAPDAANSAQVSHEQMAAELAAMPCQQPVMAEPSRQQQPEMAQLTQQLQLLQPGTTQLKPGTFVQLIQQLQPGVAQLTQQLEPGLIGQLTQQLRPGLAQLSQQLQLDVGHALQELEPDIAQLTQQLHSSPTQPPRQLPPGLAQLFEKLQLKEQQLMQQMQPGIAQLVQQLQPDVSQTPQQPQPGITQASQQLQPRGPQPAVLQLPHQHNLDAVRLQPQVQQTAVPRDPRLQQSAMGMPQLSKPAVHVLQFPEQPPPQKLQPAAVQSPLQPTTFAVQSPETSQPTTARLPLQSKPGAVQWLQQLPAVQSQRQGPHGTARMQAGTTQLPQLQSEPGVLQLPLHPAAGALQMPQFRVQPDAVQSSSQQKPGALQPPTQPSPSAVRPPQQLQSTALQTPMALKPPAVQQQPWLLSGVVRSKSKRKSAAASLPLVSAAQTRTPLQPGVMLLPSLQPGSVQLPSSLNFGTVQTQTEVLPPTLQAIMLPGIAQLPQLQLSPGLVQSALQLQPGSVLSQPAQTAAVQSPLRFQTAAVRLPPVQPGTTQSPQQLQSMTTPSSAPLQPAALQPPQPHTEQPPPNLQTAAVQLPPTQQSTALQAVPPALIEQLGQFQLTAQHLQQCMQAAKQGDVHAAVLLHVLREIEQLHSNQRQLSFKQEQLNKQHHALVSNQHQLKKHLTALSKAQTESQQQRQAQDQAIAQCLQSHAAFAAWIEQHR